MTLKEAVYQFLDNHAIFANDIDTIFERMSKDNEPMNGRWNHQTTEYPDSMLNVILTNARLTALSYFKETKPQAIQIALLEAV